MDQAAGDARPLTLGGVRPPVLPDLLTTVRVPERFSPSGFHALERCPLSQLHGLGEAERLPPNPAALLGTVLHETVVRLAWAGPNDVTEVFGEVLHRAEESARTLWPQAGLVPLRRAVGRTVWRKGQARLLAWASGAARSVSPSRRAPPRGLPDDRVPRIPTGRERRLDVPELRLAGRPDLIERIGTEVHVTDLKSGVTARGGRPSLPISRQMWLYATMLETLEPGVRVRLWLHGADRVEVPWGEPERADTRARLDDLLVRFPSGRPVKAAAAAVPGAHCGPCPVRHRCPGYRNRAPTWWGQTSSDGPVAPYDVWGEVTGRPSPTDPTDDRTALRDEVGRTFLISGAARWSFLPGERAWFFGLRPDETTPMHGKWVHPRNFRIPDVDVDGVSIQGVYCSQP